MTTPPISSPASRLAPRFARLALAAALAAPGAASAQSAASDTASASASAAAPGDILLEVKRFEVVGANPLSDSETAGALAPHLGPHRSLATLEAAAAALEARLREGGYSFHRVIIPAQKPVDGVVKLEILQFPLATVEVTGNQNFSADNIRRSLPGLVSGSSPDVRAVSRDLGLANEHPSKRVAIVLKESAKADALDAEIRVRDVAPGMFFAGLTGNSRDAYNEINEATGYTRLTIGYQNTNLFDLDHALTLSYTTSPDHLDRVKQYGAFYWVPLYGYATSVQAYYIRSEVNTGSVAFGTSAAYNVTGKGEFIGARVIHSLPRFREITHNVSLAIDDRYFDNNSTFADNTVFFGIPTSSPLRTRPLSLRYAARYEQAWGGVGARIEQVSNLSGGSYNNDATYQPYGPRNWSALRYGIEASHALRDWGLSARLQGQYSNDSLYSGEQLGLGGVASVRGLRDREISGDTGYTLTLEALGPQLAESLRPVLFFDAGSVDRSANDGLGSGDNAASIGLGARWNWDRRFDVSADLAYVLNGLASQGTVTGTAAGDIKLNFSLFYRF